MGEGSRLALVVDDEPLVRTLVSNVLRHRGWSVIEAPDAPTALAIAPEKLDLLVTDYEMPSVSGLALAEQLRGRDGGLPVVLVSGHHDVADLLAGVGGPKTAFVGKPFPVEELMTTIRSVTG
jgi:two-component system C4-dicarboxylate transport response regulator DctD